LDEQPVQLINETRRPIPATQFHPQRVDYEYERAGTASIFLFTEPLAGWREATARPSKTKTDWAVEVARLMEGRYRKCPTVILVCDNLNTHTIGAFYEAFRPARARAIVRRLRFCHTPKHGSWLNIAECEFSVLSRQCLDRRIDDALELGAEVNAWQAERNRTANQVHWQFTTADARRKLRRLYPVFLRHDEHQELPRPTKVFN
jgi:hypothetical protein